MKKVSKILEFPATPGFGKWNNFFPDSSVSHPAKINLNLLNFLVSQYTKEGDVILDPMSGSGSTGVLSALNGRIAILIELEEKFCKWIREAKKKVEQQQTLGKKGKIVVIQGDARDIPGLIKDHPKEISSIITSPPYASPLEGGSRHTRGGIASRDPKLAQTGTYATTLSFGVPVGYSANDKNIGNLTNFGISTILFSPPYEASLSGGSGIVSRDPKMIEAKEKGLTITTTSERAPVMYSKDEKNIGNLRTNSKEINNMAEKLGVENKDKEQKESYLLAMKKVYEGCFKVLKPGGQMILIVKDFIQKKKLVLLSEHTTRLCEYIGFSFEDHLLFKLPQTSFWRVLERKKWEKEGREYPEDLSYEHILIFRKEIRGDLEVK